MDYSLQIASPIKLSNSRRLDDPARPVYEVGLWHSAKDFIAGLSPHGSQDHNLPPLKLELTAPNLPAPVPLAIMVVEDNKVNSLLTLKMLHYLGYQADAVPDGVECVAALQRQDYHLVLMDLQMPRMDGLKAAREIRRLTANKNPAARPYICALSANVMAKDRAESRAAGMDDFLPKPLRLEALKVVVNRVAEALKNPPPPGDGKS